MKPLEYIVEIQGDPRILTAHIIHQADDFCALLFDVSPHYCRVLGQFDYFNDDPIPAIDIEDDEKHLRSFTRIRLPQFPGFTYFCSEAPKSQIYLCLWKDPEADINLPSHHSLPPEHHGIPSGIGRPMFDLW